MMEHKWKKYRGFTSDYNVTRLVYFEEYEDMNEAVAREKELKKWSRRKKVRLIESRNPEWADLACNLDPPEPGLALPPLWRRIK